MVVTLSTKQTSRKIDGQAAWHFCKAGDEWGDVWTVYPDSIVYARDIQRYDLNERILKIELEDGSKKVFDPGSFYVQWR